MEGVSLAWGRIDVTVGVLVPGADCTTVCVAEGSAVFVGVFGSGGVAVGTGGSVGVPVGCWVTVGDGVTVKVSVIVGIWNWGVCVAAGVLVGIVVGKLVAVQVGVLVAVGREARSWANLTIKYPAQ